MERQIRQTADVVEKEPSHREPRGVHPVPIEGMAAGERPDQVVCVVDLFHRIPALVVAVRAGRDEESIVRIQVHDGEAEFVRDRIDHDDAFGRHADLALIHERPERCGLHRLVQIGILEHD